MENCPDGECIRRIFLTSCPADSFSAINGIIFTATIAESKFMCNRKNEKGRRA
jgi:hypothetical protein